MLRYNNYITINIILYYIKLYHIAWQDMVATFFIQIHNARLGNDMKYHEMTSSLSLSLCTALAGLCPPFGLAGADTAVLNRCKTSQSMKKIPKVK